MIPVCCLMVIYWIQPVVVPVTYMDSHGRPASTSYETVLAPRDVTNEYPLTSVEFREGKVDGIIQIEPVPHLVVVVAGSGRRVAGEALGIGALELDQPPALLVEHIVVDRIVE